MATNIAACALGIALIVAGVAGMPGTNPQTPSQPVWSTDTGPSGPQKDLPDDGGEYTDPGSSSLRMNIFCGSWDWDWKPCGANPGYRLISVSLVKDMSGHCKSQTLRNYDYTSRRLYTRGFCSGLFEVNYDRLFSWNVIVPNREPGTATNERTLAEPATTVNNGRQPPFETATTGKDPYGWDISVDRAADASVANTVSTGEVGATLGTAEWISPDQAFGTWVDTPAVGTSDVWTEYPSNSAQWSPSDTPSTPASEAVYETKYDVFSRSDVAAGSNAVPPYESFTGSDVASGTGGQIVTSYATLGGNRTDVSAQNATILYNAPSDFVDVGTEPGNTYVQQPSPPAATEIVNAEEQARAAADQLLATQNEAAQATADGKMAAEKAAVAVEAAKKAKERAEQASAETAAAVTFAKEISARAKEAASAAATAKEAAEKAAADRASAAKIAAEKAKLAKAARARADAAAAEAQVRRVNRLFRRPTRFRQNV